MTNPTVLAEPRGDEYVMIAEDNVLPRGKRAAVPPNAPLQLTLQEGPFEPNSAIRVLSVAE
jgi:hypothetical protein